jgi:hypothetical protein
VADARGATQFIGVGLGQCGLQIGQPSGPTADRESTMTIEYGHPSGVVAAILHPAQGVDHHSASGPVTYIRHDSAHE